MGRSEIEHRASRTRKVCVRIVRAIVYQNVIHVMFCHHRRRSEIEHARTDDAVVQVARVAAVEPERRRHATIIGRVGVVR